MADNPFKNLTLQIVKTTEPITHDDGNGTEILVYAISDFSATFEKDSKKFLGMSCNVLGLNFVYTNSDFVVVDGDEVRSITDKNLIQRLEEFATWRTQVLAEYDF